MASLHVVLGLTLGVFATAIHISGDDLGPGDDPFKTGNVIVEFGGSGMRIQVQNADEAGGEWGKHGEFNSDYISRKCDKNQDKDELKKVTLSTPYVESNDKCLKMADGSQRLFVKTEAEAQEVYNEIKFWADSINFVPQCQIGKKCVGIPQFFVSGGYLAKYMEFVNTEEGAAAEPNVEKFKGDFNDLKKPKPVPNLVKYIAELFLDFKVDMDEALLESIAFDQWMKTATIQSKEGSTMGQQLKNGKYLWLTAGSTTVQLVKSDGNSLATVESQKKTETYNMLSTSQSVATKKLQSIAPNVPADIPIVLWNHLASLLVQMGPNTTLDFKNMDKKLTNDKFANLAFGSKDQTTKQMADKVWGLHEMTFGDVKRRVEFLTKTPDKNYDFGSKDDGGSSKGLPFRDCIQWKTGVVMLNQALQTVNVKDDHPVFVTKNGFKGPDLGAAILKSDAPKADKDKCDEDHDGKLTKEEWDACGMGTKVEGGGESEDAPAEEGTPVKTTPAPVKTTPAPVKKDDEGKK
jgi:hypothetical protein